MLVCVHCTSLLCPSFNLVSFIQCCWRTFLWCSFEISCCRGKTLYTPKRAWQNSQRPLEYLLIWTHISFGLLVFTLRESELQVHQTCKMKIKYYCFQIPTDAKWFETEYGNIYTIKQIIWREFDNCSYTVLKNNFVWKANIRIYVPVECQRNMLIISGQQWYWLFHLCNTWNRQTESVSHAWRSRGSRCTQPLMNRSWHYTLSVIVVSLFNLSVYYFLIFGIFVIIHGTLACYYTLDHRIGFLEGFQVSSELRIAFKTVNR